MEKKKLVINCAVCDAREPSEGTLEKYESIYINSATVLVTPESEELLAQYPVSINSATQVRVPKGAPVKTVNGKMEINAGTDVTEGTFLIVNGSLTVVSGGESNLKKYSFIEVNGKMLYPEDRGVDSAKISVNGALETYPAGAVIMKNNFAVDKLFVLRAKAALYWSNRFIFVDSAVNPAALSEKGVRFSSKKAIVAEPLAEGIIPLLNEDCDIVLVPEGTVFVKGELTLDNTAILRYGTKLFVNGDIEIPLEGADALSKLEYLYVNGNVSIAESLQKAFFALKAAYDNVKVVKDCAATKITDKISVKIDKRLLEAHPEGILVTDCAEVKVAKDVPPELIMERLSVSDCASVSCSEEQESALYLVCDDVASIGGENKGIFGMMDGILGDMKDKKVVNAAEYRL